MEERLQTEWSTHLPDQAEKEQAISKLATQVEEQVRCFSFSRHDDNNIVGSCKAVVVPRAGLITLRRTRA